MMTPTVGQNNMDNTIATTTGLSYGSGLAGVLWGMTLNEWLAIGGFVFMALTYFTNLFYRERDERRKQEMHDFKLQQNNRLPLTAEDDE